MHIYQHNTICRRQINNWAAPSEFGTYRLCEQWRFRRACASAQSRQNLRCSLIQAVNQEEPSDRKPDPWLLWTAGHAQLKFVMTECSKTQIRLTRPNLNTTLPKVAWLYLFVTPQLRRSWSGILLLGRSSACFFVLSFVTLFDAAHILWTVHARVLKIHIWIPHEK